MPINPDSVFGVLHRLHVGELELADAVADVAARDWTIPAYSYEDAAGGGDVPVPRNDWEQVEQARHDGRIDEEQYRALREAAGPIRQRRAWEPGDG